VDNARRIERRVNEMDEKESGRMKINKIVGKTDKMREVAGCDRASFHGCMHCRV
jgi:hypothetical protein